MIVHILSSHRSQTLVMVVFEEPPDRGGAATCSAGVEGVESMTISTHARLLILACSLVAGRVALGQTFGSIDGEARDATGAPVAGVAVSATNKNTNAVRNVITNDAG